MQNIGELKKYTGTNPKPDDFNEYWDKAVAEMLSTAPKTEFIKADFSPKNSECYHMYFTGVRGARIHCKHVRPKNAAGKLPAVLLFHGYGSVSDEFSSLLSWASEGYAVFALDCRGQSGLSEDVGGVKGMTASGQFIRGIDNASPDDMLFRHMFLDTAQLAHIVHGMSEIDTEKIYAHGGSQGGALTVACAALSPHIKKAAIVYPFLSDYKKVWEMGMAEQAYVELKIYFRNHDPRHEREDEIFTKLGYIDVHNLADKISADVLFFTGLSDNICPPVTQFAVYNNLKCKKDIVLYPDFGHESLPQSTNKIIEFFNN